MTEHLANTSEFIPARIKASQVSGNTFECKLRDGAECFSGRVEMSNFGTCIAHYAQGSNNGRGRTLHPLSVFIPLD